MVGEDALGDDDEAVVKSSQDVDTTILFTKPVPNYGDVAFGKITFYVYLDIGIILFKPLLIGLSF